METKIVNQDQKNNEGQDNPNPLDQPAIPLQGNFPMRRVEPERANITPWHSSHQTRSVPGSFNGRGDTSHFRILP